MMGRLRARSRMSRKMRTRSVVSAAISGSAPSSWRNSRMPGLVQRGGFEHLLFLEHLGGVFEALVLEEALDQFAARVFGLLLGPGGRARQQHLALDVDEQRGGVDELAGHIHVGGAQLVDVGQELRRDFGDGDVVDVDVLLADQVEQQVERAVVDLADDDREGRLVGVFAAGLEDGGDFLGGGSSGLAGTGSAGSRCGKRRGELLRRGGC